VEPDQRYDQNGGIDGDAAGRDGYVPIRASATPDAPLPAIPAGYSW
jgi:hypothetical protein